MVSDLLTKWLAHYDPIHRGWTLAGIANGVCATGGFSFPRIRGGYLLRREAGGAVGASSPVVGAAEADADMIRTFPWVTHEPGTSYVYGLTAINGGGCENVGEMVTAATAFDDGGGWLGAVPAALAELRVTPEAGGTFLLRWICGGDEGAAAPAAFRIYHDGASGVMDYQTVVASVAYRRGRVHYVWRSQAFGHGQRIAWAVRAASAGGGEALHVHTVTAEADAEAPAATPAVLTM